MKALAESQEVSQDFGLERLENLLTHENVVIRHDVDYVPGSALQMARMEAGLNVSSVFYVRPNGDYEFADHLDLFDEILRLGHEIGPHVDLRLERKAKVPDGYMIACCQQDYEIMHEHLPISRFVSFHAPPRDVMWREVDGFVHSLNPKWMGRYIADSRGVFHRNPERELDLGPILLNLHPEWWFLTAFEAERLRVKEAVKP